MGIFSKLMGCGSYLPKNVVTNAELLNKVNTSDEWIYTRTGIKQRHFASEGEYTSDLALIAAERALLNAGIKGEDVDLIVVGTTTPDKTFPATAVRLQKNLKCRHGAAFDVQAVCSGFIYALSIVDSLIKTGQFKTAVVIGADTLSRLLNWEDRTTCVLFGDGAGAVVLSASDTNYGISSYALQNYSHNKHLLYSDFGTQIDRFDPSATDFYIHLEGPDVFKKAVSGMCELSQKVLDKAELDQDDIDWLIPHQANERIIYALANKMNFPHHKTIVNIKDYGNTSAATIPIALCDALEKKQIQPYQKILFTAFGAGLSCAAMTLQWGERVSPIADSDASLPPCDIDILQKIKENHDYFIQRRNI